MKRHTILDEKENANFSTRMQTAIGYGMQRDRDGRIYLKDALITLLNHDLDALNGRELLCLTKIK